MVNTPKAEFIECYLATIDCYLFIFIHFIHNFALVMFGSVPLIQSVCCLLVAYSISVVFFLLTQAFYLYHRKEKIVFGILI